MQLSWHLFLIKAWESLYTSAKSYEVPLPPIAKGSPIELFHSGLISVWYHYLTIISLYYPTDVNPGIPTFSSHAEHRRHILIHTAATFRDFSRKGFTEGMSGHISVRDPEFEDYIWMNPLGKHFGLMTAGDLICLDVATGKVVGGNRVSPSVILHLWMLVW